MKIGFVGAGRMGAPMVGRLVAAGHQVRAVGRTEDKRAAVAALGAIAVEDPAAAVTDADVVVVCVFTDDQVRALCLDDDTGPGLIATLPAGAVLVLHTTGSPGTAQTLAAAAAARGVEVLDAPVSRVTVFVGGCADAVALAGPALSAYADPVLHVGPTGSGQLVKLVNNTLFAAQIGMTAEAVRLGERLGLSEAALLTALPHGSGASRATDLIARAGSTAAFIGAVGEFIGKDVATVRRTAAELGTDLGRLDGLVDAGLGS